ncbi:hypothetical protein PTRG_04540 [Pyrenophora tritici-repentis Pt-1C-BFP]|uniref:Uncharacterized protein n=1 Tax=Pyrenophora tritici-repentis (strain Pt-1C-BFP) TaxID=426418 RepID=B2W4J0_PYRTR|nr:uncharacterized protein PTRG_04540 [Pyrenophora tritici-repentis Pt-1C-BFP]EDU47447.1 hypothetical protein PTRG_04540 [Pyrenophora tritici-repentis Pt-1C-BFP]
MAEITRDRRSILPNRLEKFRGQTATKTFTASPTSFKEKSWGEQKQPRSTTSGRDARYTKLAYLFTPSTAALGPGTNTTRAVRRRTLSYAHCPGSNGVCEQSIAEVFAPLATSFVDADP